MAQLKPRDYLTFAELMTKWQISENDLRHAIICGALKPCIRLNGRHENHDWEDVSDDEIVAFPMTVNGRTPKVTPNGWQYLQDAEQTTPFDCQFRWVSHERDPIKMDYSNPNRTWFQLDPEVKLKDVMEKGVFLNEEIKKYETDNPLLGGGGESSPIEKPLSSRERESLLKLVIGMAIRGYSYDPVALKSAASKEITDDLASLGISIDTDTVRKYLKVAANTVLPAKPRQS